jgi:lipopolysaccharide export system protein LptA/lipopolysaccharide export system protein LptC
MNRKQAAKYARWSAGAALLLATLTAGVYAERKWVAYREAKKAPPPAPEHVTRQSSGLTFSKGEGTRKIFTVEASRATDFKDKEASLLEDVKITIFGKMGDRNDVIHTHTCQYEKTGGDMACEGDVQMDLESKADAERAAKDPGTTSQKVHVETQGVVFNRATGLARTDKPVKFVFPNGHGDAVGVEYQSEQGAVRLLHDVKLYLAARAADAAGKKQASTPHAKEPVLVTGNSMDFDRNSRTLQLYGPVEALTQTTHLQAGKLSLTLDTAFRAQTLVATPSQDGKNPSLESRGPDGPTNVTAQTLTAQFAPEGWLTKVDGAGEVRGSRRTQEEDDDFSADYGSMELWPRINQPKELRLKENVQLKSQKDVLGQARNLQARELQMEFAAHDEGGKPKRAETIGPGTIEWTDAIAQSATPGGGVSGAPAIRTKLQADKLEMEFGDAGKARRLIATGNVSTERAMPGKPVQTATAKTGVAQLLETGGWSQMDLQGDVHLREADRSGQADHATFVQASQTAVLTGKAVARDATSETAAPRITFLQTTGEIRAEGGVRSTDFSSKGNGVQLAGAPANITAETMHADSKMGKALYTGHARLWQGDSVMEADSIELLRQTQIMNAVGNVRAVFPQTPEQPREQGATTEAVSTRPAGTKKPVLWHVTAGTLIYSDADSHAHLEKSVVAQSADQKMRSPIADLYFTRAEKPASNAAAPSANANRPVGAQQISRAVGTGGVIVDQGTRTATAERGEYTASDGKFVMSGGKPMIYDAEEGTTTGRKLTFFLADDTIIVDSENGSRTLTKHRVDK